MNRNKQAFTLIELLVVVLIIAILAAVALPQYQRVVHKARIAQVLPLMKAIKQANMMLLLREGRYSLDPADWDFTLPPAIKRVAMFSNHRTSLYFKDGSSVQVRLNSEDDPVEDRVDFRSDNVPVKIWLSFPNDKWLCYPQGTQEGVDLCKHLGCSQSITTETVRCEFSF